MCFEQFSGACRCFSQTGLGFDQLSSLRNNSRARICKALIGFEIASDDGFKQCSPDVDCQTSVSIL